MSSNENGTGRVEGGGQREEIRECKNWAVAVSVASGAPSRESKI